MILSRLFSWRIPYNSQYPALVFNPNLHLVILALFQNWVFVRSFKYCYYVCCWVVYFLSLIYVRVQCCLLFVLNRKKMIISRTTDLHTRIAELGVAFQHCEFFFQFSKKHFWKKNCSPFFHFFFQFYFRKQVEIVHENPADNPEVRYI